MREEQERKDGEQSRKVGVRRGVNVETYGNARGVGVEI